ncbi:MAG TPA: hypothetical protein VIM58_03095, partial [Candidatus Methylacidiphilales bacterium]
MRTVGHIAAWCTACWLGLAGTALAASPAPAARVAVVSSPETADLAALLSTELSQESALALVERDEFAKIGDEIKLRQLASTNAAGLGQMLGADGLLFLEKTPDAVEARFTAVGLGYVLFDQRFDLKADPPRLAKEIVHRVADYASKLKLRPAEAVPVSVLNLRSDAVSGAASDLERNLTLLLESRLSAQPEYVVLERRHAGSLAFENVLAPPSSALLQGALVVDGTLTPPLDGKDEAVVRLRVRAKGGEPSSFELRGSTKDLPALAEGLANGVRKATGSAAAAVPWQPQREAREYLMEGLWGYQHNAVRTSLEALDAAALLGETAPDLTAARVAVLCGFATGSPRVYHG